MSEELRSDRIQRFAKIHTESRYKAGKSQEYLAMELGVSKKTIQNWEKGISSPTFFQSIEWFRILGLNPMPYYFAYLFPQSVGNLPNENNEQVHQAFDDITQQLTTNQKQALLYLFCGSHGSSPNSVLQLMLAHLHTPLKDRVTNASVIAQNYEIHKELGDLICQDCIQPDMEILKQSIDDGRTSAISKEFGYFNGAND